MGNTFKKVQQNGFINWQHRAILPGVAVDKHTNLWISYEQAVSQELEEAIRDEQEEPVFTIRNSAAYDGDQVLFNGDLATRLGGPFIHRTTEKRLKQLRRIAYGFYLNTEKAAGDFTALDAPVSNQCPDKAILLNSASCQKIFKELYILANRDFSVEDGVSMADAFVPVSAADAAKLNLKSSASPNAIKNYFQTTVQDEKGTTHTIIVQQCDFDFMQVENAIEKDLAGTDSKYAALLTDEARISMIIDQMTKVLCTTTNAVFTRVEVEIDTTATRAGVKA